MLGISCNHDYSLAQMQGFDWLRESLAKRGQWVVYYVGLMCYITIIGIEQSDYLRRMSLAFLAYSVPN